MSLDVGITQMLASVALSRQLQPGVGVDENVAKHVGLYFKSNMRKAQRIMGMSSNPTKK